MPTLDAHPTLAVSTVATAPSPATSGTSLVVASGEGARFGTAPFNCTVWPAGVAPTPDNAEVVRVTARATDTLTITRAQEGTTAKSVAVGWQIAATVTAKTLTDIETNTFWKDGSAAMTSALPLHSTSFGAFPTAGTSGRLIHRSNAVKGLWVDNGVSWVHTGGGVWNALEQGCRADLATVTGAITSGTTTLTITTSVFVATDVGKRVVVVGAGAAGADLETTIAGYTSATVVTLGTTASTTVSAATTYYGTDDGATLNTILTAMSSGQKLVLPGGNYFIHTPISVAKSVTFEGTGTGVTFLYAMAQDHVIKAHVGGGSKIFNLAFRNFLIGAKRARTAGSGLYLGNVGSVLIDAVNISSSLGGSLYKGLLIENAANTYVSNIDINGCVSHGVHFMPGASMINVDTWFTDTCQFNENGGDGIRIENTLASPASSEGIYISKCAFYGNAGAAVRLYANGGKISNIFLNGTILDSCDNSSGLILEGTSRLENVSLQGVWSANHTNGHGMLISGSDTRDIQIADCYVIVNDLDGIRVDGADHVTITGLVAWNNSNAAAATNYAVDVRGTADRVTIQGRLYNSGKNSYPAQNGISVAATCTNVRILQGDYNTGAGTTPIYDPGSVVTQVGAITDDDIANRTTGRSLYRQRTSTDYTLAEYVTSAGVPLGYIYGTAGQGIAFKGPRLDVRAYGTTANQLTFTGNGTSVGVSTTNASTAATMSAGHPFTAADVGKRIVIWTGTTYTQNSIAAVSGNTMTLGQNATATIAFGSASYATDDTVAIQAAITAAQTLGAAVYVPAGTYWVSALTITGQIGFVGDGPASTVLVSWADGDTILAGGASAAAKIYGVLLQDFTVLSAGPRGGSGAAVGLRYAGNCLIRDVVVSNSHSTAGRPKHGVALYKGVSQTIIEAVRAVGCSGSGLFLSQDGSVTDDRIIDIWTQDGCRFEVNQLDGVAVVNSATAAAATIEGLYFGQASMYGNTGAGIRLSTGASGPINNTFLNGTILDTNGTNGLTCEGTAAIGILRLSDVWVSFNTGSNVVLSANVKDYEVTGGFNVLATVHGLSIASAINGKVSGVNFLNNNRGATGAYAINFTNPGSPTSLNVSIIGNRIYNSTTWAFTQNGVSIPANVTDVDLQGNYLDTGTGTTPLNNASTGRVRDAGNVTSTAADAADFTVGGTTRSTSFEATNYRRAVWSNVIGSTTIVNTGIAAPTNNTTPTNVQDADGDWLNFPGAATSGTVSGWTPAAFTHTRRDWRPIITAVIKTDASLITNSRFWIGASSAALTTVDTPSTQHVMAFRYAVGVDGTAFWRTVTAAGGSPTVTTTTAAIAVNTKYILRVDASVTGQVRFFVNGVLVATHTATLPTATTPLGLLTHLTNTAGSSTRALKISSVTLENLA